MSATADASLAAEYGALGIDPPPADPKPRPRFTVKRLPMEATADRRPWCINDAERPWWVGRVVSFERAIELINGTLDDETGRVT